MNNMDSIKPTAEVYYDQYELEAIKQFEKYISTKDEKLLLASIENLKKTGSQEGPKMANMALGLYHKEKANKTIKTKTKIKELKKAYKYYKAVFGDAIDAKKVKLELLKELAIATDKSEFAGRAELFLQRAKLFEEIGDLKNSSAEMTLHYMSKAIAMNQYDFDNIQDCMKLMLESAKSSENEEFYHGIKAFYHRVMASLATSPKEAIKELESALAEKTDTLEKEEIEANLNLTKAFITPHKPTRDKMLINAAKVYVKKGGDKHLKSIGTLLTETPLNTSFLLEKINTILEQHKELEKQINLSKRITPGPRAVFYHQSYFIERLKNIRQIIKRLGINRKKITELHIKENKLRPTKFQKKFSKKLQEVLGLNGDLTEQMRLDMEVLFIFGNMVLDQWALIIKHLYGLGKLSKGNNKEYPFKDLYLILKDSTQNNLKDLWDKHSRDIVWLYYNLRFYRNVFIEHLENPWQRGSTMSVYGEDFNLHIPVPPGWLDEKEVESELKSIYHLAPQKLKDMPDDYWEKKNLKRVLEVTFQNIDGIPMHDDREKVWKVWKKLGGSTPSYDVIANRLLRLIETTLKTIINEVKQNPESVDFGQRNS